jgi:ubiquinone/menaquinone biosynthesis C-methylase UbiE
VKTDYFLHDELYRKKRTHPNYVGWDTPESLAASLRITEEVMAWPEIPASGRLLELGCGAANQLAPMAARYEVSGIDISPAAVEWGTEVMAEAGIQTPDLRVGDVRNLPWGDETFDVVRDGHLLHCIIGDDRAAVLGEVDRVLAPGGVFVVFTMCGDKAIPDNAGFDPTTRLCVTDGVATRYIGRVEDLAAELEAAGFELLRTETFDDFDETEEFVAVARPLR